MVKVTTIEPDHKVQLPSEWVEELLQACQLHGVATTCTDDDKLAGVCRQVGLAVETPIDSAARRQIAAWESANLPTKGLARVLFQVRQWIGRQNSDLAQDFWNLTGGGSHLP